MSWTNTARLSLEALDARIVPDATPILLDPGPEPPANASTTAPPAPRPIEQITADIKAIALAFKAQEKAYAQHAEAVKANGGEIAVVQGHILDISQALANAKDEDKPALETSLAAFEARLAVLNTQKKDLEDAYKRLDTNYAGLQAMFNALLDELKRANAQQAPPPEVEEAIASQTMIESIRASIRSTTADVVVTSIQVGGT